MPHQRVIFSIIVIVFALVFCSRRTVSASLPSSWLSLGPFINCFRYIDELKSKKRIRKLQKKVQVEQWELERELNLMGVNPDILWQPFETLSGGEQTKFCWHFLLLIRIPLL